MKRQKTTGTGRGKALKKDKVAKGLAGVGQIKGQGTRKFRKKRAGGTD